MITQIMDSTISSSLVNNKQQLFLHQCSPIFVEYQLMREFVLFQQQNLSHIYILPSASSPYKWNGVMFIHYGQFQGAIFRLSLLIPQTYPECECPKVVFDPIPFHPLVNPLTGVLNTSKAFPNWKSNINQLWQVLLYAKRIFHVIDSDVSDENENDESHTLSFNIKAAKMYKNDKMSFQMRVNETIKECHEKINDPPKDNDANNIIFGEWNPNVHEELRFKLLAGDNVIEEIYSNDPIHPSSVGLSWVQKGTIQMFSKSGT